MKTMKIIALVISLFSAYAAAQSNETCIFGYWGLPTCQNPCGQCFVESGAAIACDAGTGSCLNGCLGGYSGSNCDKPYCKGGCGSGECLAPNYCGNCGNINKVSPNCEDIRLRGLLGSLMAFIVIISSITLCGFGSVWYKRKKEVPVSM